MLCSLYFFPIFLFSSFLFFLFFSTFIILMVSKKCWLLNDMDISNVYMCIYVNIKKKYIYIYVLRVI